MAYAGLDVVAFEQGAEIRGEVQGRRGLAEAADVVAFAFDGE